MPIPAPHHRYTFRDYLELEEVAGVRHEFYDGEIYAMAGGTPEDAAMAAAITTILGRQVDTKSCRVYSSDLRLRVLATGLATYPDVTVVCGSSERDPHSPTHVTNPKVLVGDTGVQTTLDLGLWTLDCGPWTLDLGPWTWTLDLDLDLGLGTLDFGR